MQGVRKFLLLTVAMVTCFLEAQSFALGDNIYVSDNSSILKFSTGGGSSTFVNENRAAGLAFDHSGNIFTLVHPVTGGSTSIHEVAPTGADKFYTGAGSTSGYGVAFDGSGNLYASVSNEILKVTTTGQVSVFSATSEAGGLAFDSAGYLYAANYTGNRIDRFAPDGSGSIFATTGLNHPDGLAFDQDGNLYVASSGSHTVEKFTPQGTGSVFASAGGSLGPVGLAFDSSGTLYATDWGSWGSIEALDANGNGTLFTNTLNEPTYLAISPGLPLPEPVSLSFFAVSATALIARRR